MSGSLVLESSNLTTKPPRRVPCTAMHNFLVSLLSISSNISPQHLPPSPIINKMGDIQQYKEKLWFPLESNPALLNEYISNLGFSTDSHQFVDVFSTESWALDMIAQPVVAVVALFPMTEKVSKRRKELHAESVSGVSLAVGGDTNVDGVWYVKQRIRNACGTIGECDVLDDFALCCVYDCDTSDIISRRSSFVYPLLIMISHCTFHPSQPSCMPLQIYRSLHKKLSSVLRGFKPTSFPLQRPPHQLTKQMY